MWDLRCTRCDFRAQVKATAAPRAPRTLPASSFRPLRARRDAGLQSPPLIVVCGFDPDDSKFGAATEVVLHPLVPWSHLKERTPFSYPDRNAPRELFTYVDLHLTARISLSLPSAAQRSHDHERARSH